MPQPGLFHFPATTKTSAQAGVFPDARRPPGRNSGCMIPTVDALGMVVATLLMLLAGLSKKRLEWKPRNESRRRRRPRRPV